MNRAEAACVLAVAFGLVLVVVCTYLLAGGLR